ncbi:MAG: rod shape-determining protein RodA [Thermodesulfobacteriota bacterium]
MFDRRLIENLDWGLLFLTLFLCGVGLVTIYSAVSGTVHADLYLKQWVWYGAGLGAVLFICLLDYKSLERWAYPIYSLCMGLLVAVLFAGKLVGGSRRWLALGPLTLQPSELAKIAVVLVLARFFARRIKLEGFRLRELGVPLALTALPFGLIVQQPDLGTGLVLLLIAGSMTLFVKIERRSLAALSILGGLAASVGFFFLKDYQRQRILTFLDPDRDPMGAGYHIIQSKIAIGSGMIHGKGLFQGTQNTLAFRPEQHTDFIFSVLAEEWGFIGAFVVCLAFFFLLARGLGIAFACRDHFGTILAIGATAMIFWQALINLGMVMGLMPVVGMPLPLVSYGGSSILTIMVCIGLLANVSMRRFVVR